jgi:NTE family protein
VEDLYAPEEPLRDVDLFAGLDAGVRAEVVARAATVELPAGRWLFRQGDPGDTMYVVLAGRLEILRESPEPTVLRIARAGEAVGELALLTDTARSASVRARRDSRLLCISRERFTALLAEQPAFARALIRTLGALLQESRALTPEPTPLPATIAVLPVRAGLPAAELAAELAAQLGPGTAVLSEPSEAPGEQLDRAERDSDRVLLVSPAPPGADAWADFCLRQGDRVLLVAEAAPRPGVQVGEALGRCEVLLAGSARPGWLAGWLDELAAPNGRLVGPRSSWGRTLHPLARSLTGRSTALVLSGGGARGLAHIGVLDALLDAGVEIDRVGGCSMGALIGSQFAMGLSPDEIRDNCEAELVERNPLGDYTLPLVALVRGMRAKAMVQRLFGERLVEELPREFSCVSCDLVTSELVLHRRGRLFEAVGASFCLPAIGPPVMLDDAMLVDGGVLNNLPVEPFADSGEGVVIASDVTSQFQVTRRSRAAAGRARARFRETVLGLGHEVPLRLPEIVVRTITLGSIDTVEASQRHADLVIRPAVSDVGMVGFERIDDLRHAGREATRATLEANPELAVSLSAA